MIVRRTRTLLTAILALTLWTCLPTRKKDEEPPASRTSDRATNPPPGLLLQLSVAPVPEMLERVSRLLRQAGVWEVRAGQLGGLFTEIAGSLSSFNQHVDWRRSAHALWLAEPSAQKGASLLPSLTSVWLVPIKNPRLALRALRKHCRPAGRIGDVHRFGGPAWGLLPCEMNVLRLPKALAFSSSAGALKQVSAFGRRLTRRSLRKSVELRIYVESGLRAFGIKPKKIREAMTLVATALAMLQGDFTAAPAIKKELEQLLDYALSARDVGIAIEQDSEAISLSLFATARPGGKLHGWIRKRRSQRLRQLALLPSSPVFAAFGASPAEPGSGKKLGSGGLLWRIILSQLPAPLRPALESMRRGLKPVTGAELAVGLVRARPGKRGACLLLTARPADPKAARDALRGSLQRLFNSLRAYGKSRGFPARALKTKVGKQSAAGVSLVTIEIDVGGEWPKAGRKLQQLLRTLAGGDTLTLAITADKRWLAAALGQQAATRLARYASRLKRRRPVRDASIRSYARNYSRRLGLIHLSLVDLAKILDLFDDEVPLPKKSHGGVLVHWGVNPYRRQVDLRIRLPIRHLKASAPLWETLVAHLMDQLPDPKESPLGSALQGDEEEMEDAL